MGSVCTEVFRARAWNQGNITAQHGMNAWPHAVELSDMRNLSQKPADHQGQIPTLLGRGGGWRGMEGGDVDLGSTDTSPPCPVSALRC